MFCGELKKKRELARKKKRKGEYGELCFFKEVGHDAKGKPLKGEREETQHQDCWEVN